MKGSKKEPAKTKLPEYTQATCPPKCPPIATLYPQEGWRVVQVIGGRARGTAGAVRIDKTGGPPPAGKTEPQFFLMHSQNSSRTRYPAAAGSSTLMGESSGLSEVRPVRCHFFPLAHPDSVANPAIQFGNVVRLM